MSTRNAIDGVVTVPCGVGSAAGVSEACWFVAVVKNNTEKSVSERLEKLGYECYVPTQRELRVWKNGRRATLDRVVIPAVVFIHCTEHERRVIVALPYIIRFMTDRAGLSPGGGRPIATIPDIQIRKLQFMVGNSESPVTFSQHEYRNGDLVKVIRGRLSGLEGMVHAIDDRHSEIVVSIDFLGNARLRIATIDIEPAGRQ